MSFFRSRERRSDELDAEIAGHLAMAERDLIAGGMSPDEARATSRREFGNVAQIKQTTRDMWSGNTFADLTLDFRYAVRTLSHARSFTVTAIATLAIGISAATAIYSVADHVVLRPLPYPDADRLVVITEQIKEMRDQFPVLPANASHYLEWRRVCSECDDIAAMREGALMYAGDEGAEVVGTVRASANMLPMLGAHMVLGRVFTETEDNIANGGVVVLTHAYWRRKFGGDTSIVGKSVSFADGARQVIGVLAPDFYPPKGSELNSIGTLPKIIEAFIPLALTEQERNSPGDFDYTVIAKLRSEATLPQLRARLVALQADISARRADHLTIDVFAAPMQQLVVGDAGRALLILLGAVGALLLIVCVNLTNLSLARQAGRVREAAVRMALGAPPGRLVRLAITESLMVALAGGVLGIVLSRWGLELLLYFAPSEFPRLAEVRLDLRVLAVASTVSILTGVLFGTMPALRFGKVEPGTVLKATSRNITDGKSAANTRAFLIASQIGLSATLLYATGLFLTSYVHVLNVDKGFSASQILAMDVALPRSSFFQPESRTAFYDELLPLLRALPGVRAVGMTTRLPLEGENQVDALSRENDQRAAAERPLANIRQVDDGYFKTLGITARRGRMFSEADRGRDVVVLSARAAQMLWPNEEPIGKRMSAGRNPEAEVIGIVADVRTTDIEHEGSAIAYLPYWNRAPLQSTLLLNTTVNPTQLVTSSRAAIRTVNKSVPVSDVRTVGQVVTRAMAARRFQLALLVLFALSAVIIASIGIYGVIAHSLIRRSGEIGVRMALGAERGRIHWLVMSELLNPVAIGLIAGVCISLALGQIFRALLFEVSPLNAPTLMLVVTLLALVATVACLIPARRATRGGALLALRAE